MGTPEQKSGCEALKTYPIPLGDKPLFGDDLFSIPHRMSLCLKTFLLVYALILGLPGRALSQYRLPELRQLLVQAKSNEKAGDRFVEKMADYNQQDPVLLGYKAASQAIEAKYSGNPFRKLKRIRQSSKTFEQAVQLNSSLPELRFLRFTVESNTPRFLNLSQHVAEDKAFLINSLQQHPGSGLDEETFQIVRDFLLRSDRLSEQERNLVRNVKP
jgi:hypothetical protein